MKGVRYLPLTQRLTAALDSAIRLLDEHGFDGGSKDPPYARKTGRGVADATDGPKDFGNMVETGRRT